MSVSPTALDKNKLHSWTDVQGRTLEARFVRLFAGTVTIEWNGQMVPLPMSSLSPQSQALANQLASPGTTTPNPPPSTPVAPTPKPEVAAVNHRGYRGCGLRPRAQLQATNESDQGQVYLDRRRRC